LSKEGQVEIIGWMYQYYNTEPKQAVFDGLKKNIKITKDKIPAATQIFTPDWIVRYMVENSLGRIFISGQGSDQWAVASGRGAAVVSGQWRVSRRGLNLRKILLINSDGSIISPKRSRPKKYASN
jgi:hypothetical protein